MKTQQHYWRIISPGWMVLFGLLLQTGLTQSSQAQIYNGPPGTVVQYPSNLQQPGQRIIEFGRYQRPIVHHPLCPNYHQPWCPMANQPRIICGTIVSNPIPIISEPIVYPIDRGQPVVDGVITLDGPETGSEVGKEKSVVKPIVGWNQWADLPPLKGDFQAMIHQVVGDIDWLQVSHGEKMSPTVNSFLAEARTNLETSCKVCDEDPDLFAGTGSSDETVRDVTSQLKTFRDLLDQALLQPEMQSLKDTIAPARLDMSKRGAVFGSLDGPTKQKMFAMFAVETLQKRANQLVSHAEAVEQGTFRPVGVANSGQSLKVGDLAPDFSVQTIDGGTVSLSSLRGKKVVLAFNRGHY